MFPEGTPILNFTLGACLVSVLVATINRYGLLPTVAALATHFVLLRAPITTDLGSWRGPLGLWFVGVVAALFSGLGACYIASARTPRPASPRRISLRSFDGPAPIILAIQTTRRE